MQETPRTPAAALWKGLVLVAIIAVGFALWRFTPLGDLLERETLLAKLETVQESPWAAPVMMGLLIVVTLAGAPISPVILANGAIFGAFWGCLANIVGCLIAAAIGFSLARALGTDLFRLVVRPAGIERLEAVIEDHGFWTLVRLRFLPIPFGLLNYAAGLTPLRPAVFLGGSALPMLPVLAIYSYIGHALLRAAADEASGLLWRAGLALLALFVLSWLPGRKLRSEVESETEDAA